MVVVGAAALPAERFVQDFVVVAVVRCVRRSLLGRRRAVVVVAFVGHPFVVRGGLGTTDAWRLAAAHTRGSAVPVAVWDATSITRRALPVSFIFTRTSRVTTLQRSRVQAKPGTVTPTWANHESSWTHYEGKGTGKKYGKKWRDNEAVFFHFSSTKMILLPCGSSLKGASFSPDSTSRTAACFSSSQ